MQVLVAHPVLGRDALEGRGRHPLLILIPTPLLPLPTALATASDAPATLEKPPLDLAQDGVQVAEGGDDVAVRLVDRPRRSREGVVEDPPRASRVGVRAM